MLFMFVEVIADEIYDLIDIFRVEGAYHEVADCGMDPTDILINLSQG